MGSRFAVFVGALSLLACWATSQVHAADFQRGDTDASGALDISDGIRIFGFLFLGDPSELGCEDAADADDSGTLDITDGIFVLNFLFSGGAQPPAPFEECGDDPTSDTLGCLSFTPCGPTPPPTLDAVTSPTREASITLSGSSVPGATITVLGGAETVVVESDGSFSVEVSLKPNRENRLFVSASIEGRGTSAPAAVEVIQDGELPFLFVDGPQEGEETFENSVTVYGRVGDRLSGFMGLTVLVDGEEATVNVGQGTNGTFERAGIPLALGENVIVVSAEDEVGNVVTQEVRVARTEVPAGPTLRPVSGNNQRAVRGVELPDPIVVEAERDGVPFAGKIVTFHVTRSDGRLAAEPGVPAREGSLMMQARTDTNGLARAYWTLGTDAGCANNRVRVTSASVAGTVTFCASADPGTPDRILIGSGNSQRAEVGSVAPELLEAWVSDGCNGAVGEPVTFTVVRGGGLVDGEESVTVNTDRCGHASVAFTVGSPGNNVVEATYERNPGLPATFVTFGLERDEFRPTGFSGIVLDNGGQPVVGATVTIEVDGHEDVSVLSSDEEGRLGAFMFDDLGERQGPAHLVVDGNTATNGVFPSLHYEVVIVPNAPNALPAPVKLPELNENTVPFDGSEDVTLTIPEVEGLEMHVPAHTVVTLPSGTVVEAGSGNAVELRLSQVHHDDIPMPMPDGASPPFAWTLQPSGARFDPPLAVTYPNMSGLPAGAASFFLSFDHDRNEFAIVATGRVSDDGSTIVSDPGTGIATAGWGCNCPPYSVTGSCRVCSATSRARNARFTFSDLAIRRLSEEATPAACAATLFAYSLAVNCAPTVCSADGRTAYRLNGGVKGQVVDKWYWSGLCDPGPVMAAADAHENLHVALGREFVEGTMPLLTESLFDEYESQSDCAAAARQVTRIYNEELTRLNANQKLIDSPEEIEACHELFRMCSKPGPLPSCCEGHVVMSNVLDAWKFSVNGQVETTSDPTSFEVLNVSAPDLFGVGGPGTPPDSQGDDFTRVVGTRLLNGVTEYTFSEPFRVLQGQAVIVDELSVTDIPPPLPEAISLVAEQHVFAVAGGTPLTVMATLGDGSLLDVTTRDKWTTYRVSNPAVLTIEESESVVQALGRSPGNAFVTATNDGATAVLRLRVAAEVIATDVEGVVVHESGAPAVGATVRIASTGASTTTGEDGRFLFRELLVPANGPVTVRVVQRGDSVVATASASAVGVADGVTDLGTIILREVDGLVAYWPFDDESNPTENAVGESHGSLMGGAGFVVDDIAPVEGNVAALQLASIGQFVDVPHDSILSFEDTEAFAIACWLKQTEARSTFHVFGKRLGCSAIHYQLAQSGRRGAHFSSGSDIVEAGQEFPFNEWTHVVVAYDGEGELSMWWDGENVLTRIGFSMVAENESPLRIGTSGTCPNLQTFPGFLDEFRIYDRVLSPEEIQRLASGQ